MTTTDPGPAITATVPATPVALWAALWRPSVRTTRRVAVVVAGLLGLLVVTGAVVRLTGSGLGCPTWPACHADSINSGLTFHGVIEFGNRVLTVGIFLAGIIVLALVVWRARRRDCYLLVGSLFAGYLAEAVLGGLTVLTHLNPLLVAAHLLLALGLLWSALEVWNRLGRVPGAAGTLRVRNEVRWLSRGLVAGAAAIIVVGTLVTGTGPWAGSRVDNRLPFNRRAITQLHSDLVLVIAGAVVVLWVLLRMLDAPADIRRRSSWVLGLLVVQAAIGFTQYATGLPGWLIGFHVAGATAFWAACLLLSLSLTGRPRLQ
ncbi:MAG TPA: COX15/CtaA family protein [Mycobacteriales bacterium]